MSNLFGNKTKQRSKQNDTLSPPIFIRAKSFGFSRCNWIDVRFLVLHKIPFTDAKKKLTKTLTWKLSMFRWHLIKNAVLIPELKHCWWNCDGIHDMSFQRKLIIIIIIFMYHMDYFYEHTNEFHFAVQVYFRYFGMPVNEHLPTTVRTKLFKCLANSHDIETGHCERLTNNARYWILPTIFCLNGIIGWNLVFGCIFGHKFILSSSIP